jgi:hypothetical protein
MAESTADFNTSEPPIRPDLEEHARRLGLAEHLDPSSRAQLAELLRKLASELDQAGPSPHEHDLAATAAHLVRAVEDRRENGIVDAARENVEQAVARAESNAPVVTDLVLQLIDVLAGLGI